MNLKTEYLGIPLPHPLIIGSSTLTNDVDTVRQLEDEGAAALVLRSIHEEEITGEQMDEFFHSETHGESSPEAESYFPVSELALGPDEYLEHLRLVKQAVDVPVIASLCGTSKCGWVSYARLLEQAGANAVELDLYHSASDAFTLPVNTAAALSRNCNSEESDNGTERNNSSSTTSISTL